MSVHRRTPARPFLFCSSACVSRWRIVLFGKSVWQRGRMRPALERLRWEDVVFEASLGYSTRLSQQLKTEQKNSNKQNQKQNWGLWSSFFFFWGNTHILHWGQSFILHLHHMQPLGILASSTSFLCKTFFDTGSRAFQLTLHLCYCWGWPWISDPSASNIQSLASQTL